MPVPFLTRLIAPSSFDRSDNHDRAIRVFLIIMRRNADVTANHRAVFAPHRQIEIDGPNLTVFRILAVESENWTIIVTRFLNDC